MPIYNPIQDITEVTNALLRNGVKSSSNDRHVQVRGCYATTLHQTNMECWNGERCFSKSPLLDRREYLSGE